MVREMRHACLPTYLNLLRPYFGRNEASRCTHVMPHLMGHSSETSLLRHLGIFPIATVRRVRARV